MAVVLVMAAATLVCALVASGTYEKLVSGGFDATGTEAVRAEAFVTERFQAGPPQLILLADSGSSVDDPVAVRDGRVLTARLRQAPGITSVRSYWDRREPALRSTNAREGLMTATLTGSDSERIATARTLVPSLTGRQGSLTVGATGTAWTSVQTTDGSERDLVQAELITAPLVFIVLILVFRSVVAALLPLLVAAVSAAFTLALLRPLASLLPLSVFSTNLTTALGFGLAVDYSLFLLTRYRQEIAAGASTQCAVTVCLRTSGRAALYSAVTITAAMSALFLFPVPFLGSMACAGIVVTLCSVGVSCVLLPALLILLGLEGGRRSDLGRPPGAAPRNGSPPSTNVWQLAARAVCRYPLRWGTSALLLLAVLLLPFAHVQSGPIDERVLPRTAQSHAVADQMKADFPGTAQSTVVIAAPTAWTERDAQTWDRYARAVSQVDAVTAVQCAGGHYQSGQRVAPPTGTGFTGSDGMWMSASVAASPATASAVRSVTAIRALSAPAPVHVGGDTARFIDTQQALRDALLPAAAVVVGSTGLLLFLLTGSILIPVKAVTVAALSLSACFGAVVWVFQDGHGAELLGVSTVTGTVEASMLLLVFCVAFGLSMDYEVFLLSCIQEEHRRTGDNRAAVEAGIARTGRLVTVAAIAVAVPMAAMVSSGITLLKLLGFGLALAVIVDATLVRGVLVPAAMSLAGAANWWAPTPLRRLHNRFGLHEAGKPGPDG
ncbi:MMPL family transporter [Streptomyces sp. NBC_00237]|uniref:MMPL family transporter n=1 Tax=Streptomyces sp. NBC_00237 TaxID=2975687 RepID=UPI002256F674|nr:MMPL family transporter [Streptomyces sp. NBC_00237]MCX5205964.1 MMPL family transporter [Streptomyces sp. NBC_00237]